MRTAPAAAVRFAVCATTALVATACSSRPPEPVVLELRTAVASTAFIPDTLSAPAGATVTLRLSNEGDIAHNLVVVRDEEAVQPIVLAAYTAIATQYVPTGFDDDLLASIPLVYPGQTLEVTFTMPQAGSYTYVCLFPGHGSTMRGVIVAR